jgi:hypothetical protein
VIATSQTSSSSGSDSVTRPAEIAAIVVPVLTVLGLVGGIIGFLTSHCWWSRKKREYRSCTRRRHLSWGSHHQVTLYETRTTGDHGQINDHIYSSPYGL